MSLLVIGDLQGCDDSLQKLLANETVSVEALDANYIRRSDAEKFSKPVSK